MLLGRVQRVRETNCTKRGTVCILLQKKEMEKSTREARNRCQFYFRWENGFEIISACVFDSRE